jgi:transposase-like protein
MKTPAGSRGIEAGAAGAGGRVKQRSRSVAERQRIVDASLAPGASVASVARANGVNANLVFKWIRRSREGWSDRRGGADKRVSVVSTQKGSDSPTFVPVLLIEPDRVAAKLAPAEKESVPLESRLDGIRLGRIISSWSRDPIVEFCQCVLSPELAP